jgi:hypothetical protein
LFKFLTLGLRFVVLCHDSISSNHFALIFVTGIVDQFYLKWLILIALCVLKP